MTIKLERIDEPRVRDYRISFKLLPELISKENQYDLLAGKRMRVVKTQNKITNSTPEEREKMRKVYGFLSIMSGVLGVISSLAVLIQFLSGNITVGLISLIPVIICFGIGYLFLISYLFSRIDEDLNLDPFGEVRLKYNELDTSKSFKNYRLKDQWEYVLKMGDYSDKLNFRIDPEIVKIRRALASAENLDTEYGARSAGINGILPMKEIEEKMRVLEKGTQKEILSKWNRESSELFNPEDLR